MRELEGGGMGRSKEDKLSCVPPKKQCRRGHQDQAGNVPKRSDRLPKCGFRRLFVRCREDNGTTDGWRDGGVGRGLLWP